MNKITETIKIFILTLSIFLGVLALYALIIFMPLYFFPNFVWNIATFFGKQQGFLTEDRENNKQMFKDFLLPVASSSIVLIGTFTSLLISTFTNIRQNSFQRKADKRRQEDKKEQQRYWELDHLPKMVLSQNSDKSFLFTNETDNPADLQMRLEIVDFYLVDNSIIFSESKRMLTNPNTKGLIYNYIYEKQFLKNDGTPIEGLYTVARSNFIFNDKEHYNYFLFNSNVQTSFLENMEENTTEKMKKAKIDFEELYNSSFKVNSIFNNEINNENTRKLLSSFNYGEINLENLYSEIKKNDNEFFNEEIKEYKTKFKKDNYFINYLLNSKNLQ